MSVTILEALQNAEYNFNQDHAIGIPIAKEQLHNAIELLDKGYSIYEKVDPLLDKYGKVENVPDKLEL